MNQEIPNFGQIRPGRTCRSVGIGFRWVGDSVLARPRFEALTTLAAVAARTQRVRLGTASASPCSTSQVALGQ